MHKVVQVESVPSEKLQDSPPNDFDPPRLRRRRRHQPFSTLLSSFLSDPPVPEPWKKLPTYRLSYNTKKNSQLLILSHSFLNTH
ncbi:hypothetical protein RND71_024566 [Anisodus tanguticus]|uniref:Uncharacterized protein n=1 Tax=Anisodus tanguticus TaxID=243964 RepID=A0AAE1RNJ7_9SOLA|nr:hypothetical protein RND71_024566 [Anisodus tanguticus]